MGSAGPRRVKFQRGGVARCPRLRDDSAVSLGQLVLYLPDAGDLRCESAPVHATPSITESDCL